MRRFVRQSIKGGRVCGFNQYYKSKICDEVLKILSEELNVKVYVYDIIEALLKYKNDDLKNAKAENENRFIDYRDIDEDKLEKYIDKKLGELPLHQFLQRLSLNVLFWSYDGNRLYPSALSDDNSICSRKKTGYVYTKDMQDDSVD